MRIRAQDTNFLRAHYNKMRAEHYRMNTSGLDKECALSAHQCSEIIFVKSQ